MDTPTSPDNLSVEQHAAIARRAYALWEQRGRPEGQDMSLWLEAEAAIQDEQFFRHILDQADSQPIDDTASAAEDSDAVTPDSGSEVATGHGRLPARHLVDDR
jgi:hypothetical protein